ncbi:sulfatase-like hydrolase/transferase [Mycoplasmatota bacterium zrk1]
MPKYLLSEFSDKIPNSKSYKVGVKGYPFLFVAVVFLCLLSIDMIFRYINYGLLIDPSFVHILLYDLTWSLLFVSILLMLPAAFRKPLFFLTIIIFIVVAIGQSIARHILLGVLSFSMYFESGKGVSFASMIIDAVHKGFLFYLISFGILLFFTFLRFKLKANFKKRFIIVLLSIIFVLTTGFYTSYYEFNNRVESTNNYEKFVYLEEHDVVAVRLGLTTYTIKDFYNNYLHLNTSKYNLDNDKDNLLGQLEEYLNKTIHKSNDYSGMFEDKNLILIQAESLDHIAITEEVMPTLYSMKWSGLYFENFFAPMYMRSTSDTEFAVQTGILPSGIAGNSLKQFTNNKFPDALVELFNERGYSTAAFHNYDDTYYNRREFYNQLGYGVYMNSDNLEIEKEMWTSDVDLMKQTVSLYDNERRFFIKYITVSSHPPYDFSNPIIVKNYNHFKDFDVNQKLKCYYSAVRELDDALSYLLVELTKSNRINNTVIAIYGDHFPMSISEEEILSVTTSNRKGLDLYRTPLIVWTPGMKPEIIREHMAAIDITPTLANLFGHKTDYTSYIGTDIFTQGNNVVFFRNRSWVSEVGEYNSITQFFSVYDEKYITDYLLDYVRRNNKMIEEKFTYSRILLDRNYFVQTKI